MTAPCFSTNPGAAQGKLPPPPRSCIAALGTTKNWVALSLLSCWLGFERGHLAAAAYLEVFQRQWFLSLFQCLFSLPTPPAKGATSLLKDLTLLLQPWLLGWSRLQDAISSWREEDTKPSDAVRGAQNNVSVFERQTSQMGAASSAAGDGWFKMIKQQVLQNAP